MVLDRYDKPNSVARPRGSGDGHLSRLWVAPGLERHSPPKRGTALHRDKDLAVSPSGSPREFVCLEIAFLADVHCFRSGRHCSHLAPYGGRALPATCL